MDKLWELGMFCVFMDDKFHDVFWSFFFMRDLHINFIRSDGPHFIPVYFTYNGIVYFDGPFII